MADSDAHFVRQHRARQRAKGLRVCPFWLPDIRSPAFVARVAHDIALLAQPSLDEHDLLDPFERAAEDWQE